VQSLEHFLQNFVFFYRDSYSSTPLAKFKHYRYWNVGLSTSNMSKFEIFGINFPQMGKSSWAIIFLNTKFGIWEGVSSLHPQAKFHHCSFRNVGSMSPKLSKLVIFGMNTPFVFCFTLWKRINVMKIIDLLKYSRGILRPSSHSLPTSATSAASWWRNIFSIICPLPSPVTFTINGLPAFHTKHTLRTVMH